MTCICCAQTLNGLEQSFHVTQDGPLAEQALRTQWAMSNTPGFCARVLFRGDSVLHSADARLSSTCLSIKSQEQVFRGCTPSIAGPVCIAVADHSTSEDTSPSDHRRVL
jgi:hypothetical protein